MKTLLRATALIALLILALPAAAAAKPGDLDRSFGAGGRTILRVDELGPEFLYPEKPLTMAKAADGRTAVTAGRTVFLLVDGKPVRSFGGGSVKIVPPPGTRFLPGGVAIDSQGRVLVAGTVESTVVYPFIMRKLNPPPPASAAIYRFLPDGRPDPAFGTEGALVTDFDQEPREESPVVPYPAGAAVVKASGLVVDQQDRPVIAGTSVKEVISCNYLSPFPSVPGYVTRTYIARLTITGAPDPSFGNSGIYTDPGREDPANLALSTGDVPVFSSTPAPRCKRVPEGNDVINVLTAGGESATAASVWPSRSDHEFGSVDVNALTVDRRGRVLVLVRNSSGEGGVQPFYVRRFRPDGDPDPTFGNRGKLRFRLPFARSKALAVDPRGRILIASPNDRPGNRVLVQRLVGNGRLDRSYGLHGRASVGFEHKTIISLPQLLIDGSGRATVAALVARGNPETAHLLALARLRG